MRATAWARGLWRRVTEPGQWPRRRLVGESTLALVLGLLAAGLEDISGAGWPRTAAVAIVVAALSLLRRALPTPVLLASGALAGVSPGGVLLLMPVAWSAGRRIDGVVRALVAFTASGVLCVGLSLIESPPPPRPWSSPLSSFWSRWSCRASPAATGPSGAPCCAPCRSATPNCCASAR
ncbi:hypothetical protein ACQEVX_33790 [Streptomyces syringium]|uniref:hypothetical protein n=1 Tax=Streptomyces syringium TaxID=76729 RepID=UPI003D9003E7